MPKYLKNENINFCYSLKEIIPELDVLMTLRMQKERMSRLLITSEKEYSFFFGLNERNLNHAKSDLIILHPGPINRGVEIDCEIADNSNIALIIDQVKHGIAIRQSVLEFCNQ